MTFKIKISQFYETQTMKIKQNQTFFHETYSNLILYLFLSKILKYFNNFRKSKLLSFMAKVNPKNGNETNSDIFFIGHIQIWHHFHLSQNTNLF